MSLVKAMLQKDDNLYSTKDFSEKGFVFSPFDINKDSILIPQSSSECFDVEFSNQNTVETSQIESFEIDKKQKALHVKLVESGIEAIKNGDVQKVVLSRVEEYIHDTIDVFEVFQQLLNSYPLALAYLWYHPKVGLWLGATPETLLKIEGRNFSIMALAGTQDYQGTLDVIWNEKELKEQQFVTDFILENITSTIENIKVSDVQTVKSGNLLHLKTDIKGQLKSQETDLKPLLHSLHPTPAVCGSPKAKAMEFIFKNENYDREFYTGFLGELNFDIDVKPRTGSRNVENRAYTLKRKSTQLYVNLRCMQIKENKALIYVGGGITSDSNAELEWEETVSKSMVVKKVL
ncbi:MAG: chorismate-binding protein [Jejuia sp.]